MVHVLRRKLWCLRNIIHTNLIACFAMYNIGWMVYSAYGHQMYGSTMHDEHEQFHENGEEPTIAPTKGVNTTNNKTGFKCGILQN